MSWLFLPSLRPFVLLAGGASLLLNAAMLVPSLYMLQVFDRVFASRSMPTLAMLSILAVLALAFAWCMDVARARALATAGDALHRALSPAILAHALRHAASGSERGAGRNLPDVARLAAALNSNGLRAVFDAPWLPLYVLVIAWMHPLLGLAAAFGALALAALAVLAERLTRAATESVANEGRALAQQAEQLGRYAEALVAMGMTQDAVGAWDRRHGRMLDARLALAGTTAHLSAHARVARQGVQLVVLALGAWLVVDAGASPGIMVAATVLLGRALQPVEHLIGGWRQLVEARAAWRRLSADNATDVDAPRLELPAPSGKLELECVVFAPEAGRAPLIKGLSLAVNPGESLGVVGASGCGKSTLLRLLLGLRTPQGGCVRLDGAEIAHWDRAHLGRHVGYLPQHVSLLPGSVAENIARLGAPDDAAIVDAATRAGAHEMILRLPDGYATRVGDGGNRLSGGQAQRIALARALYGDPRLVVLDEPDAHLDAEGQDALRGALAELKRRRVTVVVAGHRAGLMAQLDRIAVINDGNLHALGPAAAVLAKGGAANVRALLSAAAPKNLAAKAAA